MEYEDTPGYWLGVLSAGMVLALESLADGQPTEAVHILQRALATYADSGQCADEISLKEIQNALKIAIEAEVSA